MRTQQTLGEDVLLVPLGTGKGATSVYQGESSSSFAIMVGKRCRLLVDVGLGVVKQCLRMCGGLPGVVYVSHNHSDHAGELPVMLIVELAAGRKMTVVSAPEVTTRLREHRLHELYSTGKTADDIARWIVAPPGVLTRVDDDFEVVTFRGRHSEISFGMVLYADGAPILGFSSDSGNDDARYDQLAVAPVLLLDARAVSSDEHASFEEVARLRLRIGDGKRLLVTGYGTAAEGPVSTDLFQPVRIGEPVILLKAPRANAVAPR